MILQMVRNECVIVGGHAEIQISYNWKYQRRPQFFTICLALRKGCLKQLWTECGLRCLRANLLCYCHFEAHKKQWQHLPSFCNAHVVFQIGKYVALVDLHSIETT
jgi:hypothetical protein